jgi:hypothetical protein
MTQSTILKWTGGLLCAGLLATGCSKSDSQGSGEGTGTTEGQKTPHTISIPSSVGEPSNSGASSTTSASNPNPGIILNRPAKQTTDVEKARRVAELKKRYIGTPDVGARIEIVFRIAGQECLDSVYALHELLTTEQDVELKTHMVDVLVDMEGNTEAKLDMLKTAVLPSQPIDVREAAIDALVDLEDKRSLPILKELLNDQSADIREAAKDGIELLQEDLGAAGS